MFSRRLSQIIAIGITAIAIGGGAYGIVSATARNNSETSVTTTPSAMSGRFTPGGGGSQARSGPAAGGSAGTVASVSASSFTLSTSTGQDVAVTTASSTKYATGTRSTSAGVIKTGETVLVLGTTNGTTISATQVIVQPAGGGAATSAAAVVPFQRGAPSTSKQVGRIPANYTQGSGTIVSGVTANRATEAALAAYPGGIIDRVVMLSNGEYEVHNIGVNWPHHIFVDRSFKAVGAD